MSHRVGLDHATVVEAAAKLVDEEGIEQLSLGRLAERLGVRTPSLYNHVAGLPGLKHDLALFCSRELLDRLLRATIGKSRAEAMPPRNSLWMLAGPCSHRMVSARKRLYMLFAACAALCMALSH